MAWGLKRYQESRQLHFITFSCYDRAPLLDTPHARDTFLQMLERVRSWYSFVVIGYVVMPEHVHLIVSEPEKRPLALALQMIKQMVSRKLLEPGVKTPFWSPRYYDFNVWSETKRIEKLRYLHRNPVRRGLVEKPEDWEWSSFRHYLTGEEGLVEIESEWTARKRERLGIFPKVTRHELTELTQPSRKAR
jgi:putative transposase